MNYFKKIGRGLTALALVPLSSLEIKERNRRLDERLRRLEQRREKAQSIEAKILPEKGYS
jgi:hypothetical protein